MNKNMEQNQVLKDFHEIANDNISEMDLDDLSQSLKKYVSSRNMDLKNSQDLVNLILISFKALGVPEYKMHDVTQRLNLIQIMNNGESKSRQVH